MASATRALAEASPGAKRQRSRNQEVNDPAPSFNGPFCCTKSETARHPDRLQLIDEFPQRNDLTAKVSKIGAFDERLGQVCYLLWDIHHGGGHARRWPPFGVCLRPQSNSCSNYIEWSDKKWGFPQANAPLDTSLWHLQPVTAGFVYLTTCELSRAGHSVRLGPTSFDNPRERSR